MSLRNRLRAPLIGAVAATLIGGLVAFAPPSSSAASSDDGSTLIAREQRAAVDGLTRSEARFARSSYLCVGYSACAKAGMSASGYAAANKTMYWRMYAGHNCTNYAAYRMVKSGLPNTRPWSGGGNATYWGTSMSKITDKVPAVGAVAWWRANTGPAGSAGHVAYVEKVVSADQIIVSQDSWGGDFSWAVITRASGNWPSGFVHFNDQKLVNQGAPAVTGLAKVGARLTATAGTWSQKDAKISYQWYVNNVAVAKATASTLTVSSAWLGKTVRVRTTATKVGFAAKAATSAATPAVLPGLLASTAKPLLSGVVQVDHTLSLTPATWNVTPSRTTVQWYADGLPITGATGTTLALTADLAGRSITARVTASRSGYSAVRVMTPATVPVALGTFRVGRTPAVSGTAKPGRVLSIDPGSYSPGGDSVRIQWLSRGRPVPGATGATYRVRAADIGYRVSASVTVDRAGYQTSALTTPTTIRVKVTPSLRIDRVRLKNGVRLRVTVASWALSRVDGTVVVRVSGGFRQEVVLRNGIGRVVVNGPLNGLKKGKHAMIVAFRGSPMVERRARLTSVTIR